MRKEKIEITGDAVGVVCPVYAGEMSLMVREFLAKAKIRTDYIVNDSCIKCGICAKVCPANNIAVTDKVTFFGHCEVCYACLQAGC